MSSPLLIKEVLQALQNPSEEPSVADPIISLLQNLNVFQRSISSSTALESFFKLARPHLNYEVHPSGTVLIKEQDYADKLYIVLQGKIERMERGQQKNIEQESPVSPGNLRRNACVQSNHSFRSLKVGKDSIVLIAPSPSNGSFNTFDFIDSPKTNNSKRVSRQASIKIDSDVSLNELDILENSIKITKSPSQETPEGSLSDQSSNWLQVKTNFQTRGSFQTKSSLFFFQSKKDLRRANSSQQNSPTPSQDLENHFIDEITLKTQQSIIVKDNELEPINFSKSRTVILPAAKVYLPGDHFGENFCRHQRAQEKAAFTVISEEAHLLTLSREAYKNILEEVNQEVHKKSLFFSQILPSIDQRVVLRFSKYFTEKSLQKGDTLYCQNDQVDALYFLVSGEIRLSKDTIPLQKSTSCPTVTKKRINLPLIVIKEKQSFGEEIFDNEPQRQYTATVNKPSMVLALHVPVYSKIKERYEDIFDCLREQASGKSELTQGRVSGLIEPKGLDPIRLPTRSLSTAGPQTPASFEEDAKNPMRRTAFKTKSTFSLIQKTLSQQTANAYWATFSRLPKEVMKKESETVPMSLKIYQRNNSMGSVPSKKQELKELFNVRKELEMPSLKVKKQKSEKSAFMELVAAGKNNSHLIKSPKKKLDETNSHQKLVKYRQLSMKLTGSTESLLIATKLSSDTTPIFRTKTQFHSNYPPLIITPSENAFQPFSGFSQSTRNVRIF